MRRLLALTMLQRGLSVGVYIVATMILARLLTPGQVGIYSLAAAFLAVASVVREFGISEFLMQDKQLDRHRIRAAYGVAIAVAWSMGAIILLLREPISRFYGEPGVGQVLTVMSLTFAVLPFATPTTALLYRDMQIAKVLGIQTVALIIGHVASVALAYRGFGYLSMAWGTVVNTFCMVALLLWTRRDGLRFLPTLQGSRPIWAYCSKYTLSGVFEQVGSNMHEFIIGRRFGFAALGLYSRASGLFSYFNQNIARGISRVLLPSFARQAREEAGQLRGQYIRTLSLYTGVIWPMAGIVAILAPEIIEVMYGSQWQGSAPLLRLLCLSAVVQGGYAFAGELLGSMGQAGARLRITSLTTPLWAALCLAAAFFSLEAIALAAAVQSTVVLMLYLRQLRRLIGFTVGDLFRATRSSMLLSACVILPAVAFRAALASHIGSELLIGLAVGLVAAGAWVGGAMLIRHPVAGELQTMMRSARRWVS